MPPLLIKLTSLVLLKNRSKQKLVSRLVHSSSGAHRQLSHRMNPRGVRVETLASKHLHYQKDQSNEKQIKCRNTDIPFLSALHYC